MLTGGCRLLVHTMPGPIAALAMRAVREPTAAGTIILLHALAMRPGHLRGGHRRGSAVGAKRVVPHGHALANQPLDVAQIVALLAIAQRDGDAVR
ncbi:MAG: hypothetical protein JO163_20265, partial [Methylobacteriaceae bacterium]|nr:hypothetical protein [Methylobacteriaceae bacterium]